MLNYCRIDLTHFGDVDGLQFKQYPMPTLAKGQVLVKVHYSGINPIDVKTRAGLGWAAQQNADKLPWSLGYDVAGQVIAIGEGVDADWLDKPVCGMLGFPLEAGCYASVRATELNELQVIPKGMHPQQAAALPLAGLTAHQALFEHGQIKANQRVLILGASGGVGHIAVQLAVDAGCDVIAVASGQRQQMLTELGAHQVLDYQQDWLTDLAPVDVLIDLVGGEAGVNAVANVAATGRIVTIPTVTAADVIAAAEAQDKAATGMLVHPCRDGLQHLLQLASANKLTIQVDTCYSAQSVADAHQHLEQGNVCGKLVLSWCH